MLSSIKKLLGLENFENKNKTQVQKQGEKKKLNQYEVSSGDQPNFYFSLEQKSIGGMAVRGTGAPKKYTNDLC